MKRILQREWLDELPDHDPRAIRSRRDLLRLNYILGHASFFLRALRAGGGSVRRLIDLGGGDAAFFLRVLRGLGPAAETREAVVVDRVATILPEVAAAAAARRWNLRTETADVRDWVASGLRPGDVLMANLFLHHFAEADLGFLFAAVKRHAVLFASCDPRRAWPVRVAAHGLALIGCNHVTRHDARISVEAGFRGRELVRLWGESDGWSLREGFVFPFSHGFVASRVD